MVPPLPMDHTGLLHVCRFLRYLSHYSTLPALKESKLPLFFVVSLVIL